MAASSVVVEAGRGDVDCTAVDAFSPVSIKASESAGVPLYADLALDFRNMELSIFNPYSEIRGYNITKAS